MMIFETGGLGHFAIFAAQGLRAKPGARAADLLNVLNGCEGLSVQVLDASKVAGFKHLQSSALMASNSWCRGENTSKSPATEILVYASAKRQIKEAISSMGISEGSQQWAVIGFGSSAESIARLKREAELFGELDDSVIAINSEKIKALIAAFRIESEALSVARTLTGSDAAAVESLILERVAISEFKR